MVFSEPSSRSKNQFIGRNYRGILNVPIRAIQNITDDLDLFDRISSLAFFSSLPILLPSLDALNWMLATMRSQAALPIAESASFLWTMPLAVMFTALALLFVCLLKTGYNFLGKTLMRAGGLAFLLGYLALAFAICFPDCPQTVLTAIGLPLGFGAGILCITWAMRLRLSDFRTSFIALIIALFVASTINALALQLPPTVGVFVSLFLACLGTIGAIRSTKQGFLSQQQALNSPGSNWWDVFGKLDVSLVEGTDDFQAPASRALFFVVTPLIMLLLFVVNRNTGVPLEGPYTAALIGCLLVVPCSVPLLFIKSDQGLINASCRLYLPLMAFCVFAANSFVTTENNNAIMQVGIDVFCTLYALLMAAMIITMAGRMRSLVIPAGSLLLIALSLVALLSYSKVDAGALIAYQHSALIALFVLAVALLLATPGSRMWRMMLEGVAHSTEDAAPIPPLQDRCNALAREHNLTSREAEILCYLGRGYSATYVADTLVVAESTVRSHRKNIYRKLDINSREELLDLLDEQIEEPHNSQDNSLAK